MKREKRKELKTNQLGKMVNKIINNYTGAMLCSVLFMLFAISVSWAKPEDLSFDSSTAANYLSMAQKFLSSGMEARQMARMFSTLMPNEDPRTTRLLRESIKKATGSSHRASLSLASINMSRWQSALVAKHFV